METSAWLPGVTPLKIKTHFWCINSGTFIECNRNHLNIAIQIYAMFLFVCKKCIWPYRCFFFFLASWAVLLEEKKNLATSLGFQIHLFIWMKSGCLGVKTVKISLSQFFTISWNCYWANLSNILNLLCQTFG